MAKHALLGPSGGERWVNCPGSARATEPIPEEYSAYAEEGTVAHEICELYLGKHAKTISPQKCTGGVKKLRKNGWYTVEMEDHCKDYVKYIKGLGEGDIYVEHKVDLTAYVPEGFGTADCILVKDSELHIVDFKYGKGVPVDTENNYQLRLYALGAYTEMSMLYDIEAIFVHIFQPRIDNGIKMKEYHPAEILEFGEEIKPQAKKAWDGVPEFKAGSWCKWCKMKGDCQYRLKAVVADVFDTKVDEPGDIKELKPHQMSDAEIAYWLPHADSIIKFMKDLKEYSEKEALKGRQIEGFKLVEGRSNRVYLDEEIVQMTLEGANFDKDMYLTPRKLLGIGKLKKNIGNDMFKQIVSPLLVKPQGKPTLVPVSDKRKEWSNGAEEVFKDE